jgi:hypothetical protein
MRWDSLRQPNLHIIKNIECMEMEIEKYAQEILKTGFVLESKISEVLRKAGWTVISNKYYEDDFEGRVREIDLLAYMVSPVQHFNVYTTLLISCKKSKENIWALLARNINLKDPNSDWWPLHAWSNDKAVTFELAKPKMARTYHEDIIRYGVSEALSVPNYEVFAFQEMNRESGAVRNDSAIFSSITSLIKAQAYELGALSQRKKSPSVYQFNLLSVVDSDLVILKVNENKISPEIVDSEHYISRYIIKRNETFSRIRFIEASCFEQKLSDYTKLHDANCQWFNHACNAFYDDIVKDWKRANVLVDEFRAEVRWPIYWAVKEEFDIQIEHSHISIYWIDGSDILDVSVSESDNVLASLNRNTELKAKVSAALKEVYRYSGDFRFAYDIPF